MQRLIDHYLDRGQALSILDVGSLDVNGSYRDLFAAPDWTYRGCDREAGPNVDLVQTEDYRLPLPSASVDLLVSGQALEHVEYFWLLALEFARVVKPGGLLFLIAPSRGPEHRYPVDCWRFYPDGFRALGTYARLDTIEVHTDWEADAEPGSAAWGDTVGVFRKPIEAVAPRITKLTVDFDAGTLESWTGDGAGSPRRIELDAAEAGEELAELFARILWNRRGTPR